MKVPLKKEHAVAALLLAIALLSLTPKLTLADQQLQNPATTVIIHASGNATSTNSGPSEAANLNLIGVGSKDANQDLQLQNMTGSLSIGSSNFTVSDGHGSATSHGNIALFATVSPNASQLFLHGTIQGNDVTFISPESHLSSMAFLILSGNINVNGATENNTSADTTGTNTSVSSLQSTFTAPQSDSSMTLQGNLTVQSLTEGNGTTTMFMSNNTLSEVVSSPTTRITTLSQSTNQTTTQPVSPLQSVTVTVTQFRNQTISVTQTVANVTVTQTETTTVTNATITQPNATTTATNSTITTSTSGP